MPSKTCLIGFVFLIAVASSAVTANAATTTVSFQVSAADDDGFAWSATDQDTTAGYLMIGDDRTYSPPYYLSAMRFTNINLPRSAHITAADLKISSLADGYRCQIYGVIQAEAADDAADFSSRYIGSITKTTAAVDWDYKHKWSANTYYTSPDLASVIQEVINHPGWSSGNSLAVLYGTRAESGKSRMFGSFESGSAAILEVTYEVFTITGYVKTADNTSLAGVSISAGADIEPAATDPNGYYELNVPLGWSGTVTPAKTAWGFTPQTITFTNVTTDQPNQNFTAFQPVISGFIRNVSGTGIEAVTVSADNGGGSDTTDVDGYYEIVVPYDWSGTVTPSKTGWNMTPLNRSYSNITTDQPNQDYTAFRPVISGYIKNNVGTAIAGVSVSSNNGGGSDTTDASGYYEVIVPYDWPGTVTPSKTGWGFSPSSRSFTNVTSDKSNQDFSAFQPVISGYIRNYQFTGVEDVSITSNNGGGSDTTDATGYYEIIVPYTWSGTVTPSKTGWYITPFNRSYSNVISNRVNQNYTAYQPVISGYVKDASNKGIAGVTLIADNDGGSDTTNSQGYYEIYVSYGWSGIITPNQAGWGFNPTNRIYSNVTSNQLNQNFTIFQPVIRGYVKDTSGVGKEGVSITATNNGGSDITDATGYYEIIVPYGWSGTATPSKTGWGFSPTSRIYTNITSDRSNHNYTAYQPVISGYVKDGSGTGIEGTMVSADNGGGSDTTDTNGYYKIVVPYDWSGTITPTKAGWSMTPSGRSYSNVITNQVNQDYTAFHPKISGYVKDNFGTGVEGIMVTADNGGGCGTTIVKGYYEIIVPYKWSGTVTPCKTGWDITPPNCFYSYIISDQVNQDYVAYQPVISGYVKDEKGIGIEAAIISSDNGGGSDTTDPNGYYEIIVPYDWSGTVTPSKSGWMLIPLNWLYRNVASDQIDQDYTGVFLYSGGDGTAEDPYLIATAEQMQAIGSHPVDWDKHFRLIADIDLSAYTGTKFNIIGNLSIPFKGGFCGDGHTISNFSYSGSENCYTGIFGYVNNPESEIKNIGLINPQVELTGNPTWSATFAAGAYDDVGHSVQQTIDGGYIIVGYTYTNYNGYAKIYLIKTDSDGNKQWSRLYGGNISNSGYSVQQTIDGGYIITGETNSYGAGNTDVYLIKTDIAGNEQWSRTFGGWSAESGYSVQQTIDGGFIITGVTTTYGAGSLDVYLIKTDAKGNEQWSRTFGGSSHDKGKSVKQTHDGGYIIVGYTSSFGAGEYDVYLIKTDASGNEQWSRVFGGNDADYGYSVQQTSDGGYIIVGETQSFSVTWQSDVYLIKVDTNGNEQWSRTFGGSDWDKGYSVLVTNDGGYIIAGYTWSYGAVGSDVYLIKTDELGNEQDSRIFDGNGWDYGYSVQQTSDGGYIIAGETDSFRDFDKNVYLIKTHMNVQGGLIGKLVAGNISGCIVQKGSVSGTGCLVGGLVGSSAGMIENCYSTSAIICTESGGAAGGLVGKNEGQINRCYATGYVYSTDHDLDGGLVGSSIVGTVTASFWDKMTSGQTTSEGGISKTTTQMQTLATFTTAGWDFANTWSICEGTNYPRLQWQIPAEDFICPDGVCTEDLAYFIQWWLYDNCGSVNDCDGADLNTDGVVNLEDLSLFAAHWLDGL